MTLVASLEAKARAIAGGVLCVSLSFLIRCEAVGAFLK
jgi:hypothetical protein